MIYSAAMIFLEYESLVAARQRLQPRVWTQSPWKVVPARALSLLLSLMAWLSRSPCAGSQQLLGYYNWPVVCPFIRTLCNKLSLGPTQLNSRPFAEGALSQAVEVCPDPGGSRVSPGSAC